MQKLYNTIQLHLKAANRAFSRAVKHGDIGEIAYWAGYTRAIHEIQKEVKARL